jgi:hypothetical protein
MAIPANMDVKQKTQKNKTKNKSLFIEIQRMWNINCVIIPVAIWATETEKEN